MSVFYLGMKLRMDEGVMENLLNLGDKSKVKFKKTKTGVPMNVAEVNPELRKKIPLDVPESGLTVEERVRRIMINYLPLSGSHTYILLYEHIKQAIEDDRKLGA